MNKEKFDAVKRQALNVLHNSNWKKNHTEFINAQFQKSEEFYKRLIKQKNGRKKIIKIFGIKNLRGYEKMFL